MHFAIKGTKIDPNQTLHTLFIQSRHYLQSILSIAWTGENMILIGYSTLVLIKLFEICMVLMLEVQKLVSKGFQSLKNQLQGQRKSKGHDLKLNCLLNSQNPNSQLLQTNYCLQVGFKLYLADHI